MKSSLVMPLLLTLLFGLGGCASYYRVPSVFNTMALPDAAGNTNSFYDKKSHQIDTDSGAFKAAWKDAHTTPEARNTFVARTLIVSDDICLTHKAEIQAMSNSLNLTFGSLTTLFSGAASVIDSTTTAQIMSAVATASNSSRSLVNAEVYQQSLAVTILGAIDANRTELRTKITSKFGQPLAGYPVELAVADLVQYHEACSFISGLTFVSKAVQQRQQTKSTLLERIDDLRKQVEANNQSLVKDAARDAPFLANNEALLTQITTLQNLLASAPE